MFALTSEQAIGASAGHTRQLWSVALGLCSGAFTAVAFLLIFPHYHITLLDLLVRALFYSAIVFIVTWFITIFSLSTPAFSLETRSTSALRTASTAIWLAPLAVVSSQKSWFALLLWVVFWMESVRLIAFLRKMPDNDGARHAQSAGLTFIFPSPNFKPALLSLAGAFLCQAALIAAIGSQSVIAVILGIFSTVVLAWRGVWMIEDSPPTSRHRSDRQPLYLLIITTWLIIFSWLPYILPYGQVRSLALLWRLFTPDKSVSARVKANQILDANKKEGGGSPLVPGAVFPGVILFPEHKMHATLLVPPPQVAMGSGTKQDDPLSIPFDGVYWLWRPPDDGPKKNAVLQYGNPTKMGFHSTDGSALWMEAHQTLVHTIALECCNAIEMVIDNAEAESKGMAMELLLRDTAVAGKPYVSLGIQSISQPTGIQLDGPVSQTLTFHIPKDMKLGKFDEIKVWFRLQWWRGDKSARIAINRFVLVPGH